MTASLRTRFRALFQLTVVVGFLAADEGFSQNQAAGSGQFVSPPGVIVPFPTNNNQYKRWDWAFRQRAYPSNSIPAGATEAALEQIKNSSNRGDPRGDGGAQWVNIGPAPIVDGQISPSGPVSGRVAAIAVNPTDATHWVIGTAQGGVWETRNSGVSWTALTDDQASLAVGAVAFAPSNPQIIYVGTGEANFGYGGAGLLKSLNGGTNWHLLAGSVLSGKAVASVVVHPTLPNTLVAAVTFGNAGRNQAEPPINGGFGVFKSTDGGTNWTQKLDGPSWDLKADPGNFANQYAARWNPPTQVGTVHRSTDSGETWSTISGPWASLQYPGRISIAVAPSNPSRVYVCIHNWGNRGLLGIWRTDNAWATPPTWTQLPTPTPPAGGSPPNQMEYNNAITVDPANSSIVYFGEILVWKYNGTTWSQIAGHYNAQGFGTMIHPDQHAFAWAGSRLIVGNDGGVFSTTTGGATFNNHNSNLALTQFYYGSVHPGGGDLALAGTQDNGTPKWTGSSGWSIVYLGDGAETAISTANPNTHWAFSYVNLRMHRTLTGSSFPNVLNANNDIGDDRKNALFIAPFAMHPGNPNLFLAGTTKLWKSSNFFSAPSSQEPSWTANSPVLSAISAIAFAPSDNAGITFAYGTSTGQLRLTTDGGGNAWVDIAGSALPGRYVTALAFHPNNANVLYVTLSGFNQNTANKPGHVFKTANALAPTPTWANVSTPVNLPHNCLAIDPANPNNIYVGTDIGVWRSTDAGGSWSHMGPESGMPNVAVYDIEVQPVSGRVFAFTHGRSTFLLNAGTVAQPPTITSFAPTNGPALTTVTVRGTKLNEATAVRFNGINAAFTAGTATNLTATVPVGATTGPISVVAPSGTANSASNFIVTLAPNIASFTPASGNVGTSVIISGANFTGASSVTFGGVSASFTVNSATQITATVPGGAATGRIAITTPNGTAQSGPNFTVTTLPVISGFNPASAGIGASIVITGANFVSVSSVSFNNVNAPGYVVNSAAQITVNVPATASTGPIRVTTASGTATSAVHFVVVPAPAITSFTPTSGAARTSVKITGTGFTGVSAVSFNNVNATTFGANSDTQITAEVPAGATTGLVRVTTPGGLATSAATFTVLPPPPNDNFAGAQGISGSSGSTAGINVAATEELNEPDHAGNAGGKSIWYQWTAPANGVWTFRTLGSDFDTLLAVYAGGALIALTEIASNNNIAGDGVSSVTFTATNGIVYRIAIDGHNEQDEFGLLPGAASGNAMLSWTLASNLPPAISSFTPGSGYAGNSVVINGTNLFGATSVTVNSAEAAFTVESLTRIVAVVPAGASTGLLRVTTPGGVATSAGNFTVLLGPGNDNFANASGLSGTNGVVTGSNEGGTLEPGEPQHAGRPGGRSVWYAWTPPANGTWRFDTHGSSLDTALAVYLGDSVNALSLVASNDDSGVLITSELTFSAVAGNVYRFVVDGFSGAAGNVVLNWSYVLALPQISNFTPGSGPVGTAVSITGTNLAGATSVRFNGVNAGFTNNSSTLITAVVPPGAATGPIQVTTPNGVASSAGSFVVTVAPPNDNFANARVVVSNAVVVGANVGATKEAGEPSHAANIGGSSVWYRWVAPSTGSWKLDTIGSGFDTTLAVYTGGAVGSLSLVFSDDDSGGDLTSEVIFNAVAGTTYQIAVDGYNGDSGGIVLRVTSVTVPTSIYYTQFEPGFPEFYNVFGFLAGQNGWSAIGTGANGFVFDYVYGLGYGAYLGFSPFNATDTYLWVPINYTPNTNTRPVVTFSTYMEIVDSSFYLWDDFEWQIYNINGDRLFSLNFDNNNLAIYYRLSTGSYINSGAEFENGILYQLNIVMDFARNRWSAILYDGVTYTTVVEHQPITNTGLPGTLGDVDAVWIPRNATAGDNYLVFDEYLVYASASLFPRILQQPQGRTVAAGAGVNLSVAATGAEPLSYQWHYNSAPIPDATQPVLTLNSVTLGQAGNYSVMVSNSEGSVTSSTAALSVSLPLAEALDTTNLTWTTDSDVGWVGQTTTTHDIVDAAQSGVTAHNQETWMQTTLAGPGQLTFWWKVSSEASSDYLEFYLDGVLQSGRISGEVNWEQKSFNLSEGLHTVRWRYVKNASGSQGQDRAWVDQVALNLPPTIAAQPQSQTVDVGQNATFNVSANGSPPLGYQWRFSGTNIGGAVTSSYTRNNVQAAHAGNYTVVVTNAAGSVTSAVAVLNISAPRPTLFAPVVTSTNVVITWLAVSGRVYQLQFKDSLTNANWTPLMPNVTANDTVASKTDAPPAGTQRYYRVQLLP